MMAMQRAEGFNDAIIGICHRSGQDDVLAYSEEKIIAILEKEQGFSREEALEYFDVNMACAWFGSGTPCYVAELTPEQEEYIFHEE